MNQIAFLPEDYEAPKSSNFYMKLQEGENKIRILSKPILGWEDWIENKPIRYRMENKPKKSFDPQKPLRHFWSIIVWNYSEEQIQILHLTQATIRNSIEALCHDEVWGAPFFYDIKIIKKGEKTSTEYLVNPLPHKPLHPYVIECFNTRPCNLEAIFENGDPFSSEWAQEQYTPGILKQIDSENHNLVPKEEIEKLKAIFAACSLDYQKNLLHLLKYSKGIDKLDDLPPSLFEIVRKGIIKERDKYQHVSHEDFFPSVHHG